MSDHAPLFGGAAEDKLISSAEGRKLANVADAVARWAVYLSVLLVPLAYWPGTLDALELPKQTLLVVATVVATVAWLGRMLVSRKLEVRRSAFHLLVAVFVAVYGVAAWSSSSRYVSLVGDFGQQKSGLTTVVCFALLYLVAVNVLRGVAEVRKATWFLLAGGLVAVLLGYLQALGLKLLPGAEAASFNLIGSSNGLGAYLAAMLAMVMGMLLMPDKGRFALLRKILLGVLGAGAILYVAALNFWALWMMIVVAALILVAYGMVKTDKVTQVTMLAVPMAAVVVGVLFMFVRFPVSLGLPAEVMPSLKASWDISREALATSPMLGSGPGTFLQDYTKFRAQDLNLTDFWNVQFDRSGSRLLTLLATTGIIGLAAFLAMVIFLGARTALKLGRGHQEDWLLSLTLFAGWSALLVGKLLYSSNMALEFVFWMLTAMLVSLEWRSWAEAKFESSPRSALILSFLFIVTVILSVAGLYLAGQRYVAARHYADGVTKQLAAAPDVEAAVASLVRAGQLNADNDLYFRVLSQAFAVQANVEAQKAGGQPDEEAARKITMLAANAVNAGKRATDLSPGNVQNWASLAAMYRDLGTATPGAVEAAEAAYAKTIELDPKNPVHQTELGRIYLAQADDAAAQAKGAKDAELEAAKKNVGELTSKAREKFDKAVELKQDYAPAHYWIAVLLEREGKTKEAVAKLESVRNYNPNDLGVGFQLAILYYQNEEKIKAIAELERLIKLNADYSNARWYLSAMYEEEGRVADAIAQIEEVMKANPENADVAKRLEALKAKTGSPDGLPEPVGGAPEEGIQTP